MPANASPELRVAGALLPQDIADLAHAAAERALECYVVRSGGHDELGWDDARFDGYRDSLAEAIRHRLAAIDALTHAKPPTPPEEPHR